MHPNEAIFISTSCISGIKTAAFTCALRTRRPAGIQPPSLHFQHARSSVYDPMGFPRFCSNVTKFKSTYSCPPKASFKKKKRKSRRGTTRRPQTRSWVPVTAQRRTAEARTLLLGGRTSLLPADLCGAPCFASSPFSADTSENPRSP